MFLIFFLPVFKSSSIDLPRTNSRMHCALFYLMPFTRCDSLATSPVFAYMKKEEEERERKRKGHF